MVKDRLKNNGKKRKSHTGSDSSSDHNPLLKTFKINQGKGKIQQIQQSSKNQA